MSTGAQAAELNGSMALVGLNVTQDAANLALSTLISATDTLVSSAGAGDYAVVPAGTLFGPHAIDLSSLTGNVINNIGTFSLSNAGFGSFSATSGNIIQRNASFLDIYVLGTFTPAGALAGFDPTPTSLRFSINQSGQSVSSAITLNSPPQQIPEPAALALLGVAALGVARYRRSRS